MTIYENICGDNSHYEVDDSITIYRNVYGDNDFYFIEKYDTIDGIRYAAVHAHDTVNLWEEEVRAVIDRISNLREDDLPHIVRILANNGYEAE